MHPRHVHIEKHDVDVLILDDAEKLEAIRGLACDISTALDKLPHDGAVLWVAINDGDNHLLQPVVTR